MDLREGGKWAWVIALVVGLVVGPSGCAAEWRERPGDCIDNALVGPVPVVTRHGTFLGMVPRLRRAGVPTEEPIESLLADDPAAATKHARAQATMGTAIGAGIVGALFVAAAPPVFLDERPDGSNVADGMALFAPGASLLVTSAVLAVVGANASATAVEDYNDRARSRRCEPPPPPWRARP